MNKPITEAGSTSITLLRTMPALMLVVACIAAGCASDGKGRATSGTAAGQGPGAGPGAGGTGMTQQQAIAALAGDWKLASLNGNPVVSATAPGPGARVPGFSITPEGGFSGLAGVNRMSSRLDLAKLASGEFSLGPIATTKMAGPPELMKLEDAFTAALGNARRFSLKDRALLLKDGTGAELARLVR